MSDSTLVAFMRAGTKFTGAPLEKMRLVCSLANWTKGRCDVLAWCRENDRPFYEAYGIADRNYVVAGVPVIFEEGHPDAEISLRVVDKGYEGLLASGGPER